MFYDTPLVFLLPFLILYPTVFFPSLNSNFSSSSGRYLDMSIYVMRINLHWGYTDYMMKLLIELLKAGDIRGLESNLENFFELALDIFFDVLGGFSNSQRIDILRIVINQKRFTNVLNANLSLYLRGV